MAKKKEQKLEGLDTAELATKPRDIAEQMFRIKFQMAMGQTDGLNKYRHLRKERARALTLLRQRELKGETIPQVAAVAPPVRKKGK